MGQWPHIDLRPNCFFCRSERTQISEGTITGVSCNLTFAHRKTKTTTKKRLSLEILCSFACRGEKRTKNTCTKPWYARKSGKSLVQQNSKRLQMSISFRFRHETQVRHILLQGAAQRGAQFYVIFAILRTLFSCSEVSHFCLKTCTPVKATP